ncbi:MAG: agmatinase family protein [Rhodobacteraceae bacterium]|nr:agmatinase family protein [Paracoccaceae bacterium]
MGAPYCEPDRSAIRKAGARVCFLGAPWDQGTIVRTGTSSGPQGVREATTQYFPYMFEYDVDILNFFRVVDCGDIPIVPGNNERSQEYMCDYVLECLEGGADVILVGGDHSVPIPGARALSRHLAKGRPDSRMGYLHIDCHLDAAVDWGGIEITNASGPPEALKLPNCHAANMAHMGSRNGLNPKDWMDFWIDNGIPIVPMSEVVDKGIESCTRFIFERAWNGTEAVYVSWDTDSLDCSCMPGTSCPECYGINAREAIQLARIAGEYGVNVLEIAELSPIFDASQMSMKLACNMIYHYLGSRAATLRARGELPRIPGWEIQAEGQSGT